MQPLFPGESGVDQLVEIIKILGTPTREEIKCMNPNYTEFKFPQIKAHPWHKVGTGRMILSTLEGCSFQLSFLLFFGFLDIPQTYAPRSHGFGLEIVAVFPQSSVHNGNLYLHGFVLIVFPFYLWLFSNLLVDLYRFVQFANSNVFQGELLIELKSYNSLPPSSLFFNGYRNCTFVL